MYGGKTIPSPPERRGKMRRRLYFLLPHLQSGRTLLDELL
jgi:hypothetical protein